MRIDVYSDVICPWCFIGKRRLDRTLSGPLAVIAADVQLRYRAYQLYPQVPDGGMDRSDFAQLRGGQHAARSGGDIYSQLEAEGAGEGIAFNFRAIKRMPNTQMVHRLLIWSHAHGKQSAILDQLFSAHFEHGRDLSEWPTLAAILDQCGCDANEAGEFLRNGGARGELLEELEFAIDSEISGVPCYVVERAFAIPGAQPVEVLTRYLGKAYQRLNSPAS